MPNIEKLTINLSEVMLDVTKSMPEEVAKTFLTSMLEISCILVQLGDITFDVVDHAQPLFKVTAQTKSGVRNLEVELIPK